MALSHAGLSDDVIISQIKMKPHAFNLTPEQLISLKTAKVSDRVIQVMAASPAPSSVATSVSTVTPPTPPAIARPAISQVLYPGIRITDSQAAVQQLLPEKTWGKMECETGTQQQAAASPNTMTCSIGKGDGSVVFDSGKLVSARLFLPEKECQKLKVTSWMMRQNDMAYAHQLDSGYSWYDEACLASKGHRCTLLAFGDVNARCMLAIQEVTAPGTTN